MTERVQWHHTTRLLTSTHQYSSDRGWANTTLAPSSDATVPHQHLTSDPAPAQDNFAHPDIEWGPVSNDPRCGVSAIRRSVAQRCACTECVSGD